VPEKKASTRQLTTYFETTAELAQEEGFERLRYVGVAGLVAVATLVVTLIYLVA
jgi:hypothetical protein